MNPVELWPWVDIAFYAVTFCGAQAVRTIRLKRADDVLLFPWITQIVANIMWAVWGAMYSTWSYVAVCILGAMLATAVLLVIVYFKLKPRKEGRAV